MIELHSTCDLCGYASVSRHTANGSEPLCEKVERVEYDFHIRKIDIDICKSCKSKVGSVFRKALKAVDEMRINTGEAF